MTDIPNDKPTPLPIVPGSHLILRFIDVPIDQTGVTKHQLPDRAVFRRAHAYETSDKITRDTPLHKPRAFARAIFECDARAEKVEISVVAVPADVPVPRATDIGELQYLDVVNHPKNQRPVGLYVVAAARLRTPIGPRLMPAIAKPGDDA